MSEYPFTCRDGHGEIGFKGQEALNDEGICPLCFLRDQVLLEIAQPRTNYTAFNLQLSSRAMKEYPYYEDETTKTQH